MTVAVHYRILRDRSHRDDDALIAPIVVHGAVWYCGACGEDNQDDDVFCWYCTAPMGSWVCDCGRRNGKGDGECSECGREKPEE